MTIYIIQVLAILNYLLSILFDDFIATLWAEWCLLSIVNQFICAVLANPVPTAQLDWVLKERLTFYTEVSIKTFTLFEDLSRDRWSDYCHLGVPINCIKIEFTVLDEAVGDHLLFL